MPTVLVADDDAFTRDVLEKLLRRQRRLARAGLEIVTAEDGEQAIARFREGGLDLIVLDLLMPKLDGFAVVEAIRGDEGGREIPIAITSGVYKDNRISRDLESQHGAHFFAKPYQIKQLVDFVADSLTGPEKVAAPAPPPAVELAGDLAARSLAAVLLDLYDDQATGALVIEHVRDRKEVELYLGHPVSVASNLREETLGQFLVGTGVIDKVQHRAGMSHALDHAKKMGEALIDLGHLTPEGLLEALTAQTRFKLARALRWPTGTWRFRSREPVAGGAHGDTLDMIDVVVAGLRDSVVHEATPASIAAIGDASLRLTERGRRLVPVLEALVGDGFPAIFRDGATVASLRGAGLVDRELHACLDVLSLCGGLEVEAPVAAAPPEPEPELYSLLFDDETDVAIGAVPLALDGDLDVDTGSLAVTPAPIDDDDALARRELVEEYLRVQGLSHYEILGVGRDADADAVRAAFAELEAAVSPDRFAELELGRDHAKAEELRSIYAGAARVLLDPAERVRYDAARTASTPVVAPSPLAIEVAFRDAEALLASGDHDGAVQTLEKVVAGAPDEAAYVATLGWAQFLAGGADAASAAHADPNLRRALELDPKSSVVHAALGLVAARLDRAAPAIEHLEKALELDPKRLDVFATLRALRLGRGEGRALERRLRRMIARTGDRHGSIKRSLFVELATLHGDVLGDRAGALLTLDEAERFAPGDVEITGLRAAFARPPEAAFADPVPDSYAPPGDPSAIRGLFADAVALEHVDRAFLAAAVLEHLAPGSDGEVVGVYQRYRPRFLVRAQKRLVGGAWLRALHRDDAADLGELFAQLGPVIAEALPASSARAEVARGTPVAVGELAPAFADVLAYACHAIDVEIPAIVVRPDFGAQVHVGALQPPVLLAGDEALTSSDRVALGFTLGRAVSFLRGGRAIAASRPARVLKRAVMAAFALSQPDALPERDRDLAALADHMRGLPPKARREIAALVQRVAREHRELDLSRWARSLARSADRVGLALCGDPRRALALAESLGGDEARAALLDFALSPAHEALRRELGTSIDV